MALVLASSSPRRQELLRAAGIEFSVKVANVPEIRAEGESPAGYAQRLAREKACAVLPGLAAGDCVLGADTVVIVGGQALEKPCSRQDAARMLRLLSDNMHEVTTGVCVIKVGDTSANGVQEEVEAETTRVWMGNISEEEIAFYVAGEEPMDKAGGYAIQGIASRWIPRIEGCYFNVVGLPVPRVYRMLRALGCLKAQAQPSADG
jgi:septum formation protein